jgi:hypothetical protein
MTNQARKYKKLLQSAQKDGNVKKAQEYLCKYREAVLLEWSKPYYQYLDGVDVIVVLN